MIQRQKAGRRDAFLFFISLHTFYFPPDACVNMKKNYEESSKILIILVYCLRYYLHKQKALVGREMEK